jgi:uncharacterized membrane protein
VKLITGMVMLMMTLRHVEEIVTGQTTKNGLLAGMVALTIIFVIVLLVGSIILKEDLGITTQKE